MHTELPACCFDNTSSWLGAPTQRTATVVGGGVRVRECARAYIMRDVFAIYDDNILPRLIMIIIEIIILYFIQIRHTDDFPSTGIPASCNKHRVCLKSTNMYCNNGPRMAQV